MNNTWTLQDAKARFSELVNECIDKGPHLITRHGKDTVVLLPVEEFRRLHRKQESLGAFFASAPRVDLQINRETDAIRPIDL